MPETDTGEKMDTERGGETTQYESIKTQTVPTDKQTGQLGAGEAHTTENGPFHQKQGIDDERAQRTAENIRYGQAISEEGVGGKTSGMDGEGQQGGYGGAAADKREEETDAAGTRSAQGYGSGSGVGA